MHLLDQYSLSTGSKISKPFIYESFISIPDGKFISFHTNTKFNSKNYDMWQDVLDIILPVLTQRGISVIQTGGPNDPILNGVLDYRGHTTVNQLAYIINRSSLHFGSDSFAVHLASAADIPLVALYNIVYAQNAGPYFGIKDKQILFDCSERLGQKPSYATEENPKTINSVMPEEIAAAIFKLLGIEFFLGFKTVYVGQGYRRVQINDFVPNQVVNVEDKRTILDIRMDYY